MDAIVEYDYNAQNDDELTIRKGDKIKNASKKEEGWMEGELNGKKGLFPDNFVKITKKTSGNANEKRKNFFSDLSNKFISNDKKPVASNPTQPTITPPIPVSTSPKPPAKPAQAMNGDVFKAKVVYSYTPVNEDELAIQENQVVEVIRLVEDGWYEGVLNGKKGVFPSNYVVKVELTENKSFSSDDMDSEEKKTKKVIGVGLGNIFSGKPIELKTNKLNPITPPTPNGQPFIIPQPPSAFREKVVARARVIYSYAPTQPDELPLQIGEIINILDKDLDDEGWWKGELGGRVGVFPDNFVEEIVNNQKTAGPNVIKEETKPSMGMTAGQPLATNKRTSTNINQNPKDPSTTTEHSTTVDHGEKIEDADTLLPLPTTTVVQPTAPSADNVPNGSPIVKISKTVTPVVSSQTDASIKQAKDEKNKIDDMDSKIALKTPSPPPYSNAVVYPLMSNLNNNNNNNNNEEAQMREEIETLKRTTDQILNDYKQLQHETRMQKQTYDDQIQKLQKALKDLVEEIDEEKKTRLALQVEIERLKKTVKREL